MSATIELKYFNSFWLKKMKSITDVTPSAPDANQPAIAVPLHGTSITLASAQPNIGPGQAIYYTISGNTYTSIIKSSAGAVIQLMSPTETAIATTVKLTFGEIIDFKYVPSSSVYSYDKATDWYIEEARIRGGYNNTTVDFGVKAYTVLETNAQQNRPNSLIYSGIFNSRTGVNNTNQFSVADDITRSVDPINGSIQKLYAEDTNLIIFQEFKVSRALIDKDAVYSADGQPMTTSGAAVIGQIQSYAGNYGIGTNPESFAVYGYRKYFVDRNRNAVLRLSQDGITEISSYGMLDFFRDQLGVIGSTGKIVGGWDIHNKQYVLSLQPNAYSTNNKGQQLPSYTLAFDEDSLGWTSFFSYIPNYMDGMRNNYYSLKDGNIWEHYSTNVNRGNFYGVTYTSYVTFVFNPNPSLVKNFNTINYEGTQGWVMNSLYTDTDKAIPINANFTAQSLAQLEANLFTNNFKQKENKFFGNIFNNTTVSGGDVIYGQSMSGIKGLYAIVTMTLNNSIYPNQAELYACSAEYVESSY
jgi:hypothetical protein